MPAVLRGLGRLQGSWKAAFSLVIHRGRPISSHCLALAQTTDLTLQLPRPPPSHAARTPSNPHLLSLSDTSKSSCSFRGLLQNTVPQLTPTAAIMPGFDFSNYNRNAALHARGVPLPKATSTGTTIVGCIFDGGVVVCTA